jgi:H/ACA ribonucleoprotein complex subunit 3
MYLRYTIDETGKRIYTMSKETQGNPTQNAHPARFSPEDNFSEFRIRVKKRAGLLKVKVPSKK